MRARLIAARDIQHARYRRLETSSLYDSTLTRADLDRVARFDKPARRFLQVAVERLGLSARAYMKIRRLERTRANLEGRDAVRGPDFAEAVDARKLDHRATPTPSRTA